MRRKAKEPEKRYVYSIFPIMFWVTCINCNHSFVRESGWKFYEKMCLTHIPSIGMKMPEHHICKVCAQTRADAINVAVAFDERSESPVPLPPPPPPPRDLRGRG